MTDVIRITAKAWCSFYHITDDVWDVYYIWVHESASWHSHSFEDEYKEIGRNFVPGEPEKGSHFWKFMVWRILHRFKWFKV